MSEADDESMRLAKEQGDVMRKMLDGLGLTPEQSDIAEEISIQLAIGARAMRFDRAEKDGVKYPSIMDAAALGLAFIAVDYRERMHRANPIPPPPRS